MSSRFKQTFLMISLGILMLLVVVWEWYPLPDAQNRLDLIPISGPRIHSTNIPLDSAERSVYTNTYVVKRYYKVKDYRFVLFAVDATKNRHAVHDPTYCITGAGWNTEQDRELTIPGGTAKNLSLSKDDKSLEVLYWFSTGDQKYSSVLRYWIETTLRRLSLGFSGSEPVLVVLQSSGNQNLDWQQLLQDFEPLRSL